jgi:WbqC-like protein family
VLTVLSLPEHTMRKTIAVVQSNYIPWRGYFDLINSVDEFILYDDVQYTIRDWRNRNIIKTSSGPLWLTIPVEVKGKYFQKIKDTRIIDPTWGRKHWASIKHSYSRAKYFPMQKDLFEELYSRADDKLLSHINYRFIIAICRILGINTTISWSMDYNLTGDKTERLVHLCQQAGATAYLSGPSAKAYLNEDLFSNEGIAVSYMDYSGYREYTQLYPPFQSQVSVIDLIFNEGPDATNYMKSF